MKRHSDRFRIKPGVERVEARNLLSSWLTDLVGHTFTDMSDGPHSRHHHKGTTRWTDRVAPTPVPTAGTIDGEPGDLVPPPPGPRPFHPPGPRRGGRGGATITVWRPADPEQPPVHHHVSLLPTRTDAWGYGVRTHRASRGDAA